MKRIIKSLGLSLFLAMAMQVSKPADAQPRIGVNISFQTFYDELSPYGDWILRIHLAPEGRFRFQALLIQRLLDVHR